MNFKIFIHRVNDLKKIWFRIPMANNESANFNVTTTSSHPSIRILNRFYFTRKRHCTDEIGKVGVFYIPLDNGHMKIYIRFYLLGPMMSHKNNSSG